MEINYNPNCDTRTMNEMPSKSNLLKSNKDHINDVLNVTIEIVDNLIYQVLNHDEDKVSDIDGYYKAIEDTFKNNKDFEKSKWYINHNKSRHHRVKWDKDFNDITLYDLIEHFADVVAAIAARKGRPMQDEDIMKMVAEIPDFTYKLAFFNTFKSISEDIEVVND